MKQTSAFFSEIVYISNRLFINRSINFKSALKINLSISLCFGFKVPGKFTSNTISKQFQKHFEKKRMKILTVSNNDKMDTK